MRRTAVPLLCGTLLLSTGCASTPLATPDDMPTVGAPQTVTASPTGEPTVAAGSGARIAEKYNLTGMALPADWPSAVPVPAGTRVVSAFAIGESPQRTWSASFLGSSDTGADKLAKPVVKKLRKAGFAPTSEYHDPQDADSGLYGLSNKKLAVYLVLGETDGHPSIVMTVRQSGKASK
ncbi:MAG: hypothetical protein ACOYEV_01510 [Candidatus Nanopelagicales bacterium]